jgi:hypothetical protein
VVQAGHRTIDTIYNLGGAQPHNVATAAPGDPGFNGGRWRVHRVAFNTSYAATLAAHDANGSGDPDSDEEVRAALADPGPAGAIDPGVVRQFNCTVNNLPHSADSSGPRYVVPPIPWPEREIRARTDAPASRLCHNAYIGNGWRAGCAKHAGTMLSCPPRRRRERQGIGWKRRGAHSRATRSPRWCATAKHGGVRCA